MNLLIDSSAWCIAQVTLFTATAAIAYWLVARQRPNGNVFFLAACFGIIAVLTLASASPWPRWPIANLALVPTTTGPSIYSSIDIGSAPQRSARNEISPPTQNRLIDELVQPHVAAVSTSTHNRPTLLPANSIDWLQTIVFVAWILAVIGAIRFAVGWVYVRQLRRRSQPLHDPQVRRQFEEVRRKLGASQNVKLRESPTIGVAATFGWRRPIVLLPASWRDWSAGELRAVLAHELAHVSQRHFPLWIASQLATVAHFYNPLVHWLGRRLRLEQELAADELASQSFGDRQRYAAVLAGLAIGKPQPAAVVGLGLFMSRPLLMRRISMLRQTAAQRRPSQLVRASSILLITTSAIAIAGLRATTAAPESDKSPGDGTTFEIKGRDSVGRINIEPTPQAEVGANTNPRYVTALIQISRHPWTLPSRAGASLNTDADWQVYRQTQLAILRSLKQLQTVTRESKIANLDLIKSQADPIRWLYDNLQADFIGASEIMYVRLNTSLGKTEELAMIVDAVVTAYMNDGVSEERQRGQMARDVLADSYSKLSQEVTAKMEHYNNMAKELGISTSSNSSDAQTELMLREITGMMASKRGLEQKLADLQANFKVMVEQQNESQDAMPKEFHIKARMLSRQIDALNQEISEKKEALLNRSEQSVELEMCAAELSQLQEIARQMSIDLERMDVESIMPERVRVIQWAM